MTLIELIKSKFNKKTEQIEILIDYKEAWHKFSEDFERVMNAFNYDTNEENTYKHIEYMNSIGIIRKELKKLCELDNKYYGKNGG